MKRMLQIKKIKDIVPVDIIFDLHVPITINFRDYANSEEATLYWSTGELEGSHFEIGIGVQTGNIQSIILLSVENLYEKKTVYDKVLIKEGFPIFKTSKWNKEENLLGNMRNKLPIILLIKKIGMLEARIKNRTSTIVFLSNKIASIIKNERVSFGLDENNYLCMIQVSDLSDSEIEMLKSSIENYIPESNEK